MAENKDIEIAVKEFEAKADGYDKPLKYYKGDQDLAFATEKFQNTFGKLFREFALNLCPAVCDAVRDKLTLTGWSVEDGETASGDITTDAWKIWQANRMGVRSRSIHREALVAGDSYAIVWVDPAGKNTTIYPQKAKTCVVFYDEESPGKILWAAKQWLTPPDAKGETFARLNLYYPDRIERYISVKKTTTLPEKVKDWAEIADDKPVIKNPYSKVPVFHFGNNADIGSFGQSELSDAIPLQNALNKSVCDLLVAMEFAAYRQRYATGIDVEYDDEGKAKAPFIAGIERLWVNESPEAKFGDFAASDLKQFLDVKDGFRIDMAVVTKTPIHYFTQTGGDFPSGEALQKAEQPFINKVNDRQESFGQVWEDLMAFALRIEKGKKDVRLFTEWEDPAPLSEKDELANLQTKQDLGIPDEQLWEEAGYGEDDIKRFQKIAAKKAQDAVDTFNAGEGDGVGEGENA